MQEPQSSIFSLRPSKHPQGSGIVNHKMILIVVSILWLLLSCTDHVDSSGNVQSKVLEDSLSDTDVFALAHDVGMECALSKIYNAPDSVKTDTSFLRIMIFHCINEALENFGLDTMNMAEWNEEWSGTFDESRAFDTLDIQDDEIPLFVTRENLENKSYTTLDTTFLFKMKADINGPNDTDSVLAQLEYYIDVIEQNNVGLSEDFKYDFLVLLKFIRNDFIYHSTLLTDRKDFLDSIRAKVRPHRIR